MSEASVDRIRPGTAAPARQAGRGIWRDSLLARFPELDCLKDALPPVVLAAAAQRSRLLETGADRVLIAEGVISEDAYLQRLSLRTGIARMDFAEAGLAMILPEDKLCYAAQSGILPMNLNGEKIIIFSPRQLTARRLARIAALSPREIGYLRLAPEKALQDFLLYRTQGVTDHAVELLRERFPALSAAPRKRTWLARTSQRVLLGTLAAAALGAVIALPGASGNLLALLYLAAIAVRLTASFLSATPAPVRVLGDSGLPAYSVIVALYREAPSVPQLLAALNALDYPREKLDIILVVETDDLATRAAIARERPPPHIRVIVSPNEGPRTKPKALNIALPFARGSFVAVYDAEDRPDPDQLRIALAAFRNGGNDLACVQASLAIENSADSVFTRMFAAEYAGQFDIVMPGYDRLGLPWPLGGTSNHFRTDMLREVCAWDPFNVTEDADLGLRFARFHYRTATIASTTWEEAPIGWIAWRNQRTRWMKGWMQTWWVHARMPRRYWRRTRWRGLIARDLIIGGALLGALAYPLLVIAASLMLGEYLVTGEFAATRDLVSPLHMTSIAAGFAISILIPLRGLARRGLLRHAWVLALMPLYWGCLSAAAWRAVLQLRSNPYKWEKTEHGVASPSRVRIGA